MNKTSTESRTGQRGAALVTVIMVSLLLITASVAMLTAVGANSRNTTDVLSETKAYYAAESGLQATVDAFRNNTATYDAGVSDPDLSDFLTYDYTASNPDRVTIGPGTYNPNTGTAYSIIVSDPDNTAASTTFTTLGGFAPATGTAYVTSRTYGTSPNTTTISYTGISTPTSITHPDASESLGSFQVTTLGTGGIAAITATRFRIDYTMTLPRPAVLSIGGQLNKNSSGTAIEAVFDTSIYTVLGGTVTMTPGGSPGTTLTFTSSTSVNAVILPVKPYRLKVLSTGYGPNGSKKILEAIMQKDLFNGLSPGAGTSMIGAPCPVDEVCFAPGTSSGVTYNGCSSIGCVPSFGLTNTTNLEYVINHPPGGNPNQMLPPPALLNPSQLPGWQSSPQALDLLVDQLRQSAQNSGRYFYNPGNTQISDPGNFTNGTGITFCEGSCKVGGDGGGVLIVTGQLTNIGGFRFKGLILVTGEGSFR
jgi:Tfp pilus assembly protein PilX